MLKLTTILALLAALGLSNVACAYSHNVSPAAAAATAQDQNAKAQVQAFISVEGTSLKEKLETALKRARAASSSKPLFWSAYSFDVRPGVAIDPTVKEFHGSMNSSGDTSIFIGTSNGQTIETRNLGIFILRDATSGAVSRLEIYNLDKRHEYSGYPVYWMDRASNEESLAYLRGLVQLSAGQSRAGRQQSLITEHAALSIGLHDDDRVAGILKDFVRDSRDERIRSVSVFWLGQIGEQAFLADLVRNEREDTELRSHAAHAIGAGRDKSALSTLQGLYQTVTNREVRHSLIHAVAENEDADAVIAFLLRVARTDQDREARQQAVHRLADVNRESVIDELTKLYASEHDEDVKQAVLHSLADMDLPRAQGKLLEIARTEPNEDLRGQAIHRLSEKNGDAMIDELAKMYDSERSEDVKRQILHAFSEMQSQRAEDRLFAAARADRDPELRQMAIHLIGERAGQRSLDLLRDTVNSNDADAEVQVQAVHAISERPADEAVPLLIKIARTHPNSEVRRMAIHHLGESGDPRAVEFFKEVLSK